MTTRFFLADTEVKTGKPRSGFSVCLFALVLLLQCVAGSAFASAPPIVDDFSADPPFVAPGGMATFTVQAHDPDCPDVCDTGCGQYIRAGLTYWNASGGTVLSEDNGVSGSPYEASMVWQAPATEGTYTISVYLADSGGFMCGGRGSITTPIDILVTLSTNQPPVIDSLIADPDQIRIGQTSDLTCIASDPDGDPITISWATDWGTVTETGFGTAIFTAPDYPGVASVTCTATDPEMYTGSQSVPVSVGDALPLGSISRGFGAPQSVAVDDLGDLFVVDRWAGGLVFSNLFDNGVGRTLQIDGLSAVAVDWNGRLLVGTETGARIIDRDGNVLLPLQPPGGFQAVADVAVDVSARRYVILYREAARIAVHDEGGSQLHLFGDTGSGPGEMSVPLGVAISPAGEIVVADTGHGAVQVFSSSGNYLRSFGALGSGAGEFVSLTGVAVDGAGKIYTTDAFHSRMQVFNPDGSLREILGNYGGSTGEFKTPAGLVVSDAFSTLVVTSSNTPSLELFRLGDVIFEPPTLDVFPSNLDFPDQLIGSVSPGQLVTLLNSGVVSVALYGVDIFGDFTFNSACGANLAPGASCTISVAFSPVEVGVRSGELVISDSSTGGPHIVPLSGTGLAIPEPAAVLSPTTLDFGQQYTGYSSAPQTVFLMNSGTAPMAIFSITAGSEFPISTDCGGSLPAGATCTITVTFLPTAVGPAISNLTVVDNAIGSPHQAVLIGEGIETPIATVSPLSVDFGEWHIGQNSTAIPVTITNTGGGLLSLTGFPIVGDFSQTNTCYTPLPAGGQCIAHVTFNPASAGPLAGTMVVQSDSPAGPQTVTLAGVGVGDPLVTTAPGALVFAELTVGQTSPPQTLQVSNSGEGPLEIHGVSVGGVHTRDFSVDSDACTGVVLPPDGTCSIGVIFEPTIDGDRSALLVLESTADTSPTEVALSGIGAYITTFITTGEDPEDSALCSDESSAVVDTFSLWTDRETDFVHRLRVDMTPGAFEAIGLIEILNVDGPQVIGSLINPDSDQAFVDVGVEITPEVGDYLIRLTPRNQADMPLPPGSEYEVSAFVGNVWNDNLNEGWDESGTELAIDNLSPDSPRLDSVEFVETAVLLTWTPPSDPDFEEVVILRAEGAAVEDRPTEGLTYTEGDTIGLSTVVYAGSGTTFSDHDLVPGDIYYYALFARDECANYSAEAAHTGEIRAGLGVAIPTLGNLGLLLLVLMIGFAGVLMVRWRMR